MTTNYNPSPWRSETQNYMIAQWFKSNPYTLISPLQALEWFGTMKLATRISEIKKGLMDKLGINLHIRSEFKESTYNPRAKYKVYWVDMENRDILKSVLE